ASFLVPRLSVHSVGEGRNSASHSSAACSGDFPRDLTDKDGSNTLPPPDLDGLVQLGKTSCQISSRPSAEISFRVDCVLGLMLGLTVVAPNPPPEGGCGYI